MTTKKTYGTNSCKFIILHHTGGGTYASNLRVLSGTSGKVSTHFLVWENWECAKIWNPTDVLWHAGASERWADQNLNRFSLWIEVVWPNKKWGFRGRQFEKVVDLVKYLQETFDIPKENVLCHHDITRAGSSQKKLWDWKSMCRKPDIARTFRVDRGYQNFFEFREECLK